MPVNWTLCMIILTPIMVVEGFQYVNDLGFRSWNSKNLDPNFVTSVKNSWNSVMGRSRRINSEHIRHCSGRAPRYDAACNSICKEQGTSIEDSKKEDNVEDMADGSEYIAVEVEEGTKTSFDIEGVPGLQITAKSSSHGLGLGLYISVKKQWDGQEILLKEGTLVCNYCDVHAGEFRIQSSGDKTVQFSFRDPSELVFHNNQQMPLLQALQSVTKPGGEKGDCLIEGHEVQDFVQGITIEPLGDRRYFVPFEPDVGERISEPVLGQLANDMAYTNGCSQHEYEGRYGKNILSKRWNMVVQDGQLVPKSIVIICQQDTRIANVVPQEIGLSYGWEYWQGTRYSETRNKIAAAIALSYGIAALAFVATHLSP